MAFGSATLNRTMMPMAAAALCYLEGLRPEARRPGVRLLRLGPRRARGHRRGPAAVGVGTSWSEPLRARYRPTPEVLAECQAVGRQLGQLGQPVAVRAGTEAVANLGTVSIGRQCSGQIPDCPPRPETPSLTATMYKWLCVPCLRFGLLLFSAALSNPRIGLAVVE